MGCGLDTGSPRGEWASANWGDPHQVLIEELQKSKFLSFTGLLADVVLGLPYFQMLSEDAPLYPGKADQRVDGEFDAVGQAVVQLLKSCESARFATDISVKGSVLDIGKGVSS
jgi:hypothetical protein